MKTISITNFLLTIALVLSVFSTSIHVLSGKNVQELVFGESRNPEVILNYATTDEEDFECDYYPEYPAVCIIMV
ncbi:hypothetical protein KKA14_00330 [bacterium]|nr:hypothetical protein [bacterium]